MAKREKGQRTNNDLQNSTQKNKDRAIPATLKTGGELRCSVRGKQFLLHMLNDVL